MVNLSTRKIYWIATSLHNHSVRNIISFDVEDDTRGRLELPICREVNFNFKIRVVESDLSVLHTCRLGATASDVWILKDFPKTTIFKIQTSKVVLPRWQEYSTESISCYSQFAIRIVFPKNGKVQTYPRLVCYIKRNDIVHIS